MTRSKHHPASRHGIPFASADRSPLSRCVDDVEHFATSVWGQRPTRYCARGEFGDLLSIDQIDELLELAARRPTFRLVRDGATISPSEYTTTLRMGGSSVSEVADVPRVASLVADGASLVLQGLERVHAPLRAFCAGMHDEISHPVQANAYLSPPAARGLGRHGDGHDVFVLQVAGSKTWEVDGLGELALEAGDVLYMPRGTQHAAATSEHASLHLTIGISSVTYRDVVRRVVGETPGLDLALPIGFATAGGPPGHDVVRDVLRRAAHHLMESDPEGIIEHERRRAQRKVRSGRLTDDFAAFTITGATRVRLRSGLQPVLAVQDGQLVVALGDRRVRMPAGGYPALQQLVAGPWVCVDDLRGLNAPSRLVVARRLLREGMLDIDDDHARGVPPSER